MTKYTKNRRRKTSKKAPMPLIIIGVGLIVVAVVFAIFASQSSTVPADSTVEEANTADTTYDVPGGMNYPAPELTLTDVDGNTVSLKDYRGQWMLVNNWATWCPPCRAEMPELNSYYLAHKDDGFILIGISAGDPPAQVAQFVEAFGIEFPMWIDLQNESLRAFQRNSLPNSFIIDPQGNIRMTWTGAISLEELEQKITPLLQQ